MKSELEQYFHKWLESHPEITDRKPDHMPVYGDNAVLGSFTFEGTWIPEESKLQAFQYWKCPNCGTQDCLGAKCKNCDTDRPEKK